MNKYKKKFGEPIQVKALTLVFIFFFALLIITITSYSVSFFSNSYQKRLYNQRMHQKLGATILTKLTSLEVELNKLTSVEDTRDLALAEKRIEELFIEIQEIIQVLQNGGTFVQRTPANFDNINEIKVVIDYTRDDKGYVVEALELLPRILDLENTAHKLISTVDKGFSETDAELKLASVEKKSFLLKQADTFLLRSRESANRIYYDSNIEMQSILVEQDRIIRNVNILSILITLLTIIFGGTLSYRVFQQIGSLLEERTLAENSLRETEARYRTVADFTYDWEYWRSPDGNLLYVSPSCERITGFSADYILEHPKFLQDLVIPEDRKLWQKHGHEIEKERTPQEIRFRIKRKDGGIVWIEHACQPITTSSGEFVGYRASNRNVTDRENARASLEKSEERYRLLAENMSDFIWVTELDTLNLSYASPSVKHLLGFMPQDILNSPIKERLSQKSFILVQKIISKELVVVEKGEGSTKARVIEVEMLHEDGHTVLCETTARFLYNEKGLPYAIMGAARDISAKVQAENALRESESLYRSLVQNSPIGILLANPEGEIISVNRAAIKILGSPSREATKQINLLTYAPLIKNGFVDDFQTCLQTKEIVESEAAYVTKWSKGIYSRYTLIAIHDARSFLIGVQVLFEDITEQINNKNDLKEQIKKLATINTINTAIITRTDMDKMIGYMLEEIAKNLSVDATDLLLFDEHSLSLTCTAQYGFQSPAGTKKTVLRVGEGYAGEAALKRKIIRLHDLSSKVHEAGVPQRWRDESFSNYYGVPLLVKGELKGILEVFYRGEEKRDQAWINFLETLAQQAAIAIDNHSLLDALRRSNLELELAYEATLEGWARALELRDYETKGHAERVVALALALAQELGVSGEELMYIRRGALLHDIGKIAISDTILLKAGPCTADEWKSIRQHPQYGYDMLKEIRYLKPSLDIVLSHHEKWDGNGYPHQLKGENIPFSARIFAIVDVWDAVTNDRPYHKAWTAKKALIYLQKEAGKHFDPRVVKAFHKIIGQNI